MQSLDQLLQNYKESVKRAAPWTSHLEVVMVNKHFREIWGADPWITFRTPLRVLVILQMRKWARGNMIESLGEFCKIC